MVSVVKLSVIFEFNSLLSPIWVFLFVVICDCKSLKSVCYFDVKLINWVCNELLLLPDVLLNELIWFCKLLTSLASLLDNVVKLVDNVFNELVLFDILVLAVDNPDSNELIFDLLTVLSLSNAVNLFLFDVLSPDNEDILALFTVLSPCNDDILVVWTSICCWNVLFAPGTDDNKLLISNLLLELSVFNNDTSLSILVDLVLLLAWYVVKLDWTFETSWASFKLNAFNAIDYEL